jgi:single-strand DNA-binding protein
MNISIITGRLTADAELKSTQNGKMVTSFTIANDTGWGDNKKTNFIPCVAWNKQAENICKYFAKGDPILVRGQLQMRNYTTNDGSKRTAYEILVDGFDFIGGKKDSEQKTEASPSYTPTPYTDIPQFEEIDTEEELPF